MASQAGRCKVKAAGPRPGSRTSPLAAASQQRTASTRPVQLPKVAMKEWNVAIEALQRGEQTILLRKGGIKEPVFKPQGTRFLLFPTSFHSDGGLLKPGMAEQYEQALRLEPKQEQQLQLGTYGEITGAWVTEDPQVLTALGELHIWTQTFVEARLKWRSKQPLTLLELRAWKLQPPINLKVHEEFFGCFSFVDLTVGLDPQQLSTCQAVPAISDQVFAAHQKVLRERLTAMQCTPLQL